MHSIFKTFFSSLKVRESKVSLFPPSKVPISSIVEQNSTCRASIRTKLLHALCVAHFGTEKRIWYVPRKF